MTRISIVAASESLRASLAQALGDHAAFEIVDTDADVVLIARENSARRVADEDSRALSARERQILALLADGLGNKQIAARLGISTNTVKTHLEMLFEKLGVASRAEAVATGAKRGLLVF